MNRSCQILTVLDFNISQILSVEVSSKKEKSFLNFFLFTYHKLRISSVWLAFEESNKNLESYTCSL